MSSSESTHESCLAAIRAEIPDSPSADMIANIIARDCNRLHLRARESNARRVRREAIENLARHFRVSLHELSEHEKDESLQRSEIGLKPGDSIIVLRHL